jgi:hypothetical protein
MSPTRIVGLLLIVLGFLALALGSISWTHDKTVVDAGPLQITTQEHERLPLPPIAGGAAIVVGLVLLVLPERRRV